jgi:XRE family transcriptional regulator, master regulator for biofilm formation
MVGEKIKKIRQNKKITQKELSEKTGISISYIQQLEYKTKENPSLEKLTQIATALGVRVMDLAEDDEDRNSEESVCSSYISENVILERKFSDEKVRTILGKVILDFANEIDNRPLEERELGYLVDDCYRYIEFLIHKLRK